MNRKKVVFDYVSSKPIESTEEDDALFSLDHPYRVRAQSSMVDKTAAKPIGLQSPVSRYFIKLKEFPIYFNRPRKAPKITPAFLELPPLEEGAFQLMETNGDDTDAMCDLPTER